MTKWKYKRLFEILPGALAWFILLAPVFLSFVAPKVLAIYMIFFLSYWLVKTFLMSYRLIIGYLNYRRDMAVDWQEILEKMAPERSWQDIYHLVIVPTYKEDIKILEASVESVIRSDFPAKNIIYVLATEERDKDRAQKYSRILKNKYGAEFKEFVSVMHPKDMPEEIIGKGPNISYAGKKMAGYFENKSIPLKNVIVTTMDADNLMDQKYLSCLTYKYLTDTDPIHKSFQPLPMYFNNIWHVPMPMRLIAMGSSFWQMIVATRPSRLRNFSAHAQSLEALKKVDFWSRTTIVEDGHQFWRTYFKFNGQHEVVPLFTPIYQDAVLAGDWKNTIKEQYLQRKRWAWGVSDIPYVMEHTIKNKKIPFIDKWANALILWEAHLTWSTTSLVLATSAWLPLVLNPGFRNTVLAFNFPVVYSRLLTVAWVGMVVSLVIASLLVPPYKGRKPFKKILLDAILTPIATPITNIIFSSIPAIHSQTRLMFGKYLEYRVTIKSTQRSFTTNATKV